jgi:hypothetical protein
VTTTTRGYVGDRYSQFRGARSELVVDGHDRLLNRGRCAYQPNGCPGVGRAPGAAGSPRRRGFRLVRPGVIAHLRTGGRARPGRRSHRDGSAGRVVAPRTCRLVSPLHREPVRPRRSPRGSSPNRVEPLPGAARIGGAQPNRSPSLWPAPHAHSDPHSASTRQRRNGRCALRAAHDQSRGDSDNARP